MNEQKMASTAQKPNEIKKSKVDGSKLDQPIKITGILTSRIETRQKENQPYYYGFFKLENQAGEFPIVFKTKPTLTKGSQVQLTGNWAKSNQSRPSFTCQAYQITSDPPNQIKINCFYNRPYSPCSFTTPESQAMEKHYRKEHYPQAKEVSRV